MYVSIDAHKNDFSTQKVSNGGRAKDKPFDLALCGRKLLLKFQLTRTHIQIFAGIGAT